MPYVTPHATKVALKPDLLLNPSDFKARAFLDAHRGQVVHLYSRSSKRLNSRVGWAKAVQQYWRSGEIVPDISWGTGCTPLLWQTCQEQRLSPQCFAAWMWLHSVDLPILTSVREINRVIGNRSRSGCSVAHRLIKARLILASELVQGHGFEVRRAYDRPTMGYFRREWRVSLRSPEGAVVPLKGSVSAFARAHGLQNSCLLLLLDGRQRQHKGWTLAGD